MPGMNDIRYHPMPDGRRIAHRFTPGTGPAILFLPGYMSDMAGSKATALFDACIARGRACLLLDYSGCGQSDGAFADGTLSGWRDEVLAVIDACGLRQTIFVGSSMGGWLMLLVGLALGPRLAGMVGIAAAPDFTEWGRSADEKSRLAKGETIFEDNPYGPDPTPHHPGFFADGQHNRLLGETIAIDCPVRLLHGQQDQDVPYRISMELAGALRSDDVQTVLVKDGDHRLSRPQDIALLHHHVDSLVAILDN